MHIYIAQHTSLPYIHNIPNIPNMPLIPNKPNTHDMHSMHAHNPLALSLSLALLVAPARAYVILAPPRCVSSGGRQCLSLPVGGTRMLRRSSTGASCLPMGSGSSREMTSAPAFGVRGSDHCHSDLLHRCREPSLFSARVWCTVSRWCSALAHPHESINDGHISTGCSKRPSWSPLSALPPVWGGAPPRSCAGRSAASAPPATLRRLPGVGAANARTESTRWRIPGQTI